MKGLIYIMLPYLLGYLILSSLVFHVLVIQKLVLYLFGKRVKRKVQRKLIEGAKPADQAADFAQALAEQKKLPDPADMQEMLQRMFLNYMEESEE